MVVTSKGSKINHIVVQREFNGNVPNLQVFILADIEAATKRFSIKNNLGEGRYGPVYKVYKLLSNYIYCGIAPSSLQCFKF
jgi:hypothetical protein